MPCPYPAKIRDCYPHGIGVKVVTKTYQAQIYITLRPSVLDPAGTAVQAGLHQMGDTNIDQVRIGKYVELTIQATDEAQAREQLNKICDQVLANPVIEIYRFELVQISVTV